MDKSKLERIEDLYCQYDFIGLVSKYWSYKDEYNSEALILANKLHCYDTVASIQQKVWDIFYDRFCVRVSTRNGTKFKIIPSKEDAIKKLGDLDKYLDFSKKIKEILDE